MYAVARPVFENGAFNMILQGVERAQSLAIAVVGIARAKRSALLNQADLRDLVTLHCPASDSAYWAGPCCSASQIAGLLQFEGWEKIELGWWGGPIDSSARKVGELRRLIEAENVMFWDREPDQSWRIVDATWISAHQDIYNWEKKPWAGGHRCRFCEMHENESLDELKRVDVGSRYGLVHERCKPHFVAWHEIAAKYATAEAAEEADKIAGRISRFPKVQQAARLEATVHG
jgi:hypothetical protein